MSNSKYYVAYGINIYSERMEFLCPNAINEGSTLLEGRRLVFRGEGLGFETLDYDDCYCTPAVVWSITDEDEAELDEYHSVPDMYIKTVTSVVLNGKVIDAIIYLMRKECPIHPPLGVYYDFMRKGYEEEKFDTDYLEYLIHSVKGNGIITPKIYDQIKQISAIPKMCLNDLDLVKNVARNLKFNELLMFLYD